MKNLVEIINEAEYQSEIKIDLTTLRQYNDVLIEYFQKNGNELYSSYFFWCAPILATRAYTSGKFKKFDMNDCEKHIDEFISEYSEYAILFFNIVLGKISIDDAMEQNADDLVLGKKKTKMSFWKFLIKLVAASTGNSRLLDQKLPKFR